jgi:hypothetical protein
LYRFGNDLAVFLEILKKAMENPGVPKYIVGIFEVYPPEHFIDVLW